jgi:Flp pilus assembly protein TadD
MQAIQSVSGVGGDVELLYAYAHRCLCECNFKRAANVFLILLHRDSNLVRNLVGLGICMRRLGRHRNACVAFGKAIGADPGNPQGAFQLGMTLMLLGKREQGRRFLEASLSRCDADKEKWWQLRDTIVRAMG